LHLLHVHAVGVVTGGEALLQAGGDDREPGPVEGPGDRCELRDDVLAVAPLLEHPQDAVELAASPLDPVDDRGHRRGVELHQWSSSCDCSDASAAVMRCLASAATVRRPGASAMPIMASGSKASTMLVDSSSARTTTLHGSTAAIDGSVVSASYASAGRQAPRMTWGATSTSSLALRVALRSISVRMPNPCSPSAARTASTAAS